MRLAPSATVLLLAATFGVQSVGAEEAAGGGEAASAERAADEGAIAAEAGGERSEDDAPAAHEGSASSSARDDDPSAVVGGELRRLNGHSFIAPAFLPSAFFNSYVLFASGGGMISLDGRTLVGDRRKDSRIFMFGQQIGGQIAVLNRVAVELRAHAQAAVAGDLEDLFSIGAVTRLELDAFPKVRFFTWERLGLQVAGGAGISYIRRLEVVPRSAVEAAVAAALTKRDVAAALRGARRQILFSGEELAVSPAVMVTQGVGPVGMQLALAADLVVDATKHADGSPPEGDSVIIGGQIEVDLTYFSRFSPVALSAAYLTDREVSTGDVDHVLSGGVHYAGRRDLSIGAVGTYFEYPRHTAALGQISFRYYF